MSATRDLIELRPGEWLVPQQGDMAVPGMIYADQEIIDQLMQDEGDGVQWSALKQVRNVAGLLSPRYTDCPSWR